MTDNKYKIRVRLRDSSLIDFKSKEGTIDENKKLYEDLIEQLDETSDFIKCPNTVIMKEAIAYIGIAKDDEEEEEG